jgi:hypothetical protein
MQFPLAIRDLTILGRQRDGNGYQYNRSLKIIENLQYMNNLDIVLALTTPNHRFSRLDTTVAVKPQQVQLQTGFRRTLPNHKTHVFNF